MPLGRPSLSAWIKASAKEVGFYSAGIVPASFLFEKDSSLAEWNQKDYAGTMAYMKAFDKRLERLRSSFPTAKSVIVLTASYYHPDELSRFTLQPTGRIARYARGKDYHKVLKKKLKILSQKIREKVGEEIMLRHFVDTGPLLERRLARLAGLGFIGKNTTLITPHGSYFFLAELVTDLELEYDKEGTFDGCGRCTLCIDACPTAAIREPFTLDARRCISYLTIEHKGQIEEGLARQMGDWVFGCDVCIDVCPFNANPIETPWEELKPSSGVGGELLLEPILSLQNDEELRVRFQGTPLLRPKREGLQRNASIVLENLEGEQHGREGKEQHGTTQSARH
ncbi:MAG: tRNA epoxyqueuosine(34) reductase QueG [Candidatus Omnitrophica bacterium]|nr:tRNA epoxyqueuosine(34) reductase QueG [Candidatus Omnitrophota bacterium]